MCLSFMLLTEPCWRFLGGSGSREAAPVLRRKPQPERVGSRDHSPWALNWAFNSSLLEMLLTWRNTHPTLKDDANFPASLDAPEEDLSPGTARWCPSGPRGYRRASSRPCQADPGSLCEPGAGMPRERHNGPHSLCGWGLERKEKRDFASVALSQSKYRVRWYTQQDEVVVEWSMHF